MKKIRIRLAPSPTGIMHIGTLRTALLGYLWAKKNKGDFILRIEDTDQTRYVEGAEDAIHESLSWAGLDPDESPKIGGPFGPYRQTERKALYQKYAETLIAKGLAYYSFTSKDELLHIRALHETTGRRAKFDRTLLMTETKEAMQRIAQGEKPVVRFMIPDGKEEIVCHDYIRGDIIFKTSEINDPVILKSDGFPTYHLAVVVDDHAMEITHVTRGDEWIPTFPFHTLLYEAFGWEKPVFVHLPLILNKDRTKMSKRKGDVSLQAFIQKGYLREGILNFLLFLGWNPKDDAKQYFTLPEMISSFDPKGFSSASAVFDENKLNYLNKYHIRTSPIEYITRQVAPFLLEKKFLSFNGEIFKNIQTKQTLTFSLVCKMIDSVRSKVTTLTEIPEHLLLYIEPLVTYQKELLLPKDITKETVLKNLILVKEQIKNISEQNFISKNLREYFIPWISAQEKKNIEVLWPFRVALSGKNVSPDVFAMAEIFGKSETLYRVESAILLLGQ